MSWRRLQVLLEGLPEGSAVRRKRAEEPESDEEAARRLFEAVSAFGGENHAGC